MITLPSIGSSLHFRPFARFILAAVSITAFTGHPLLANEEPPMQFLANGTLVGLRLGGRSVLREADKPNGFFAQLFTGVSVKEIQFQTVTVEKDRIFLVAPNGFPRLEFSVSEAGGKLILALVRVEGMPLGKDSSLMFRAATSVPLIAEPGGANVEVESDGKGIRVYWISPIHRADGLKNFGSVSLHQ
ncbi:MAG: hypothetical protein WCH43_12915 [Verrucomicrobiota bacterium]